MSLFTPRLVAGTPTNALVDLPFEEGSGSGGGVTTTNVGHLAGLATFAEPSAAGLLPAFSPNVPFGVYVPAVNTFSMDFGTFGPGAEGRAVDLLTTASPPGNGSLGALPKVTVCAWVNVRTLSTRGQIAHALETAGGLGLSLAHNSVGNLGLGINQNAANAPASSFTLSVDATAGSNNWLFVAATYDPALGAHQLKYYLGRPDKLAALDSAHDYLGGDLVSSNVDFTGPLSVGNANAQDPLRESASNAGNPLFRGLIDELRIYTNALTLDEVQQAQLNGPVTPVAASILQPPANRTTPEGQSAIFAVDATGSGAISYQWKTNGVDVPNATNASFTVANVTMADNGLQVRVGVSNSVGGVLSPAALLAVVPANPHLMYLSFTEATERTTDATISSANQNIHTANAGLVAGGTRFRQQNTGGLLAGVYPVFGTNVPVGPYAPNPNFNRSSLDMGGVLYTNEPRGLLTSAQGNRYLDFTNSVGSPANSLGSLNGLTLCGWINAGSLTFRPNNSGMGSQIIHAISADPARSGFVLSHKASWALQLNVNENPGGALNHSQGFVPVVTGPDGNAIFPVTNWVFFAVTYDGTLSSQNLNYYFGTADTEVALDAGSPQDYNKGIITNTGPVTVGNLNGATALSGRTINGDNAAFFRGFIDELHVFSRVLTPDEIKQMQRAPALPAYLAHHAETNHLVLSWEAGAAPLLPALQLQARTNLSSGMWADVSNPTNASGSIRSLAVPPQSDQQFFRLRSK